MKPILYISFFGIILSTLVFAESTFFEDPNNAFIMGNSPTTRTTESEATENEITDNEITDSEITSRVGCDYKWNCTDWSTCLSSGNQTRNCTNSGTCSDTYNTPEREQNCVYTAPAENEKEDKEIAYEGENEKYIDENNIINDETSYQTTKETNEEKHTYFKKWIILFIIFVCVWYIVFKYIWR